MVWQHQDTLGALDRSHRLSVATLAVPQCCARAQKALNFSNAVMEAAAAPPVPLDVLAHFVFRLLRDASFFHQKVIHSSQQLGLDSGGKTGEVV